MDLEDAGMRGDISESFLGCICCSLSIANQSIPAKISSGTASCCISNIDLSFSVK